MITSPLRQVSRDWRALCHEIGDRRAGSRGEQAAGDYLVGRFARMGLADVAQESFPCETTVRSRVDLRERFWKGRAAYNPELLTCSGSVFVLEPVRDQAAAEAVLADWRDHGLGQPQNAPDTDDWWANPYIRQNGYGDVAINLDLHWGLTPSKEAWYVLD